ncbi:DUF488 family protein [Solwaraspora sp. WMMB335]|uniref:DUF488 family protein, N3 subclade n=1 Tax=Solwaraspora sp. WMMB335 TaxID=3404118 RepID=UPI003B9650DC
MHGLATAGRHERVAVLCFEADEERCHRRVLLQCIDELITASASVAGRRQAR